MRLSVFVVICLSFYAVEGEECIPLKHNPCIAKCNGTTIDISKLFDYPLNISGRYDGFTWSPCKGMKCPPDSKTDSNAAVCQFGNLVDCGQNVKPIFLLQQQNPYMFSVEYPNGFTWRLSTFQFIESKFHPKTEVTLINEEPMLQYNFVVTGKCIGQPDCQP